MTALTLGLTGQDKFQLYVHKKGEMALAVVSQLLDITLAMVTQPVGYLSKEFITPCQQEAVTE
jgi:hypothetical protein